MNLDLKPEEAELLRTLLLAEIEAKRVELHHARNMDYKAALQDQERLLQQMAKRLAPPAG